MICQRKISHLLNHDFIFLGSKITADGDCSPEIKRRFLLGKKARTNLHSILKRRDIILPTKVHIVKAMFFPVVMYRYESWTIKKPGCQTIDVFALWWWRLLIVPCTIRRSNKSILKEINPEYLLMLNDWSMLKLKLQYFGHLMRRTDTLEKILMLGMIKGKRRRRQGWLDIITNSVNMNQSKPLEIVEDRGIWHVAVPRIAKS